MPALLTRTRAVGLGKESTPGTPVAATVWLPFQDNSIEDRLDRIYDNSALGARYSNFDGDTNQEWSEGNINGLIYDRSFGHLALAAMGAVSTANHPTATGVKNHTFSVANTLPSYTIALKDDNESKRNAYGCLDSLEISVEQGSHASYTSTWRALKGATVSNTPVFTAENRFRPQDVVVKIADTVAGLGAAPALRVNQLTLSISNNLITEPRLGTVQPDFYPGVVETSLSMSRLYLDTTLKDMVFGTTKKAMSIALTRTDTAIGTGTPTNPSVVFTFEPGFFSEWSREGGLDDLKRENTTYTPLFSTGTSKQFGLVLTNMETAY